MLQVAPGYDFSGYGSLPDCDWGSGDNAQVQEYLRDLTQGFGNVEGTCTVHVRSREAPRIKGGTSRAHGLVDSQFDNDHLQSIEDSIIVPELTLTVPTPEIDGTESHFTRQNEFCDNESNNQNNGSFLTSRFSYNSGNVVGRTIKLKVVSESSRRSFPNYACDSQIADSSQYLQTFASEPVSRNSVTLIGKSPVPAQREKSGIKRFSRLSAGSWFLKRFSSTTSPSWFSGNDSPSDSNPLDCTPLLNQSVAPPWHGCPVNAELEDSWTEKRYSVAVSSSVVPARVDEDGEHAASRLFGTPNIGTVATKKKKDEGRSNNQGSRVHSASGRRPRRLSLALDLWPLRRRG